MSAGTGEDERPPPPEHSDSSHRPPAAEASTDFAAAAAMAQDILSMETLPEDASTNTQSEDRTPLTAMDDASNVDSPPLDTVKAPPPNEPLAPDFFTASHTKKRFRRNR